MAEIVTINDELKFTIEEAEMFCSLATIKNDTRADQRLAAEQLAAHFLAEGKTQKHQKYTKLSHGTNDVPEPNFETNYIEKSNWYTNVRLVLSNINRLFKSLGKEFLPKWFPFLGLSYGLQTKVAHDNNNKPLRNYWGMWFLFNLFGCIVLGLGFIGITSTGLAWAGIGIAIYSYLFDVKWESYLYFKDVQKQTAFLNKIQKHYPEDKELVESFNKEITTQNRKHKEAIVLNCIILIGGTLWGLSAVSPPVFATIGAVLVLSVYSYMLAKKVYNSWTTPNGFLNNHVRLGIPKLYHKFKNALTSTPTLAPQHENEKLLSTPVPSHVEEVKNSYDNTSQEIIISPDTANAITPIFNSKSFSNDEISNNNFKMYNSKSFSHDLPIKKPVTKPPKTPPADRKSPLSLSKNDNFKSNKSPLTRHSMYSCGLEKKSTQPIEESQAITEYVLS